jgi:hypothetical protein
MNVNTLKLFLPLVRVPSLNNNYPSQFYHHTNTTLYNAGLNTEYVLVTMFINTEVNFYYCVDNIRWTRLYGIWWGDYRQVKLNTAGKHYIFFHTSTLYTRAFICSFIHLLITHSYIHTGQDMYFATKENLGLPTRF